ncbi:hypothetical protein [Duganella sp. LjRoot269]|jgi:hypothetical protein|uniref:hypothetical protein n=1 Tax=Duganella sp. LjRoot269 TaxID=3342305 RepID=UPI003ED09D31
MTRMVEQTSAALMQQVLMAIEKYDKPKRIKTDNAAVFLFPVFSKMLPSAYPNASVAMRAKQKMHI